MIKKFCKNYFNHFSGLPEHCWPGILLSFLNTTTGSIVFFLSLYLVKILYLNMVLAGMIISCYGLGRVFGGILAGKLSDQISPSRISGTCLLIKSLAFFVLIKLHQPYLLMLNLFVIGFMTYGFKTSNNLYVLKQCGKHVNERLKAVSLLYMASNLGIGCSAVIASIFTPYRFQEVFMFSGVVLFFTASYYLLFKKQAAPDCPVEKETVQDTSPMDFLLKRNVLLIYLTLACVFFVGLIISQFAITYPVFLNDAFPLLGIRASAILFILNCLLIVFFQAPTVNGLASYNKVIIMGAGAFLIGFGMLLLNISFIFLMAIIAIVVYSFGEMIFISIAQLLCYQYSEEHKKGHNVGMYQSVYAASLTVGPAIGGFIYHHMSGAMVWYLSGAIGVLCWFFCYRNRFLLNISAEY